MKIPLTDLKILIEISLFLSSLLGAVPFYGHAVVTGDNFRALSSIDCSLYLALITQIYVHWIAI